MNLAERLNEIKLEFYEEFFQLIKNYDIDRMQWDDTYEISAEAESKWDELLENNEDWGEEFWSWVNERRLA